MRSWIFASLLGVAAGQTSISSAVSALPTVDLGYGLWKATINETGQYYNFSNIRYARAPVGDLRWAPPQAPIVNRTIINDGQTGVICPQGQPLWANERTAFVEYYLERENLSVFTSNNPPGTDPTKFSFSMDPRTTEDCLFLDVIVPTQVYNSASSSNTTKSPVMVWIFGGGFYSGSAESLTDPAGLIAQSQTNPNTAPGVIYVALNYRLGAFGWMGGPSFRNNSGLANAGLYDQRFALEWIQENIHLFGGDPNKVSVGGGSAGAASVMHQITAYGGSRGDAPFQQAFPQSPAFSPSPSNSQQEKVYQTFLKHANATTLAELRNASSATLIAANQAVVYNSIYGSCGFGPVVDGTFVPDAPAVLLKQGLYSKNVKHIFSGHNSDEGFIFTYPAIQNTTAFNEYLSGTFLPNATPYELDIIKTELYPAIFNNTSYYGYNNTIGRLATLIADKAIVCNPYFLIEALGSSDNSAYLYDIGPGFHSEEAPYTFYDTRPDPYINTVNGTVAIAFQNWLLNFVATGSPAGTNVPDIPTYGKNRTMALLSDKGLGLVAPDPAQIKRCEFWRDTL